MLSTLDYKYYQPDRTVDGEIEIPDGLSSFEAFRTEDDCRFWLEDNGYNPDDWDIHEYCNDDIEEPTIIDEHGIAIPKIEELPDTEIEDLLTDEVLYAAGSIDNLQTEVRKRMTEDQVLDLDRVYGDALDKVNAAIETIEQSGDYDFSSYGGSPDTEWYDEARDEAVKTVMKWMLGRV